MPPRRAELGIERARAPAVILIGTAGWSIPRASAHHFLPEGTHLQRYARMFSCAEINSSFHRPHSEKTYAKWADAVPADFRFCVKMPRTITHDLKLRRARKPLEEFLAQSSGLGKKRGALLVQLPPSFAFEPRVASAFFTLLRSRYRGPIVFEPRHATWFEEKANALLVRHKVARVGAHPAVVPGAELPGGWPGIVYYRLHGAPRKYWSSYEPGEIAALADALRAVPQRTEAWCIFDNTASGAALANAIDLLSKHNGH
jgi:uncharacterized protein YecE (DUF72 family)